ncbi:unnamed protein product [Penicillium salamii]|nr:unnamed protein product [Penicillium salamii]
MVLADVVQNLMARSSPKNWSAEAQSLPDYLNRLSIDELMQIKFFEQLGSGRELKMLGNVVNKDACHEIRFLGRP